jgi:hypothetical protein
VIELYNFIQKREVASNQGEGIKIIQKTWYNSGIGTYARPSWRSWKYLKLKLTNMIDLAIAW